MEINKVIKRSIITTLEAIGALLLFIVVALCVLFPSTSMEIAYDMGMESSCIHFAERAYKGSDDVYFIAYATEVAIEEDKTAKIISCGEKFIKDERFETYCQLKGENYGQFIYGRVSVSKYQEGRKDEAVALAYESLDGAFPEGNALMAVMFSALKAEDQATLDAIKVKLNTLNPEGADKVYLQQAFALLEE